MHKSQVQRVGKIWVKKFKEYVDRQLFEVVIQAAVGNKVVARESVRPMAKDVTGEKVTGRDRKMKLLAKQKEGKKRMKAVGNVAIDHKAFQGFLAKS